MTIRYVCMYVCIVCLYVCKYVCMYVCMARNDTQTVKIIISLTQSISQLIFLNGSKKTPTKTVEQSLARSKLSTVVNQIYWHSQLNGLGLNGFSNGDKTTFLRKSDIYLYICRNIKINHT